MTEHPKEWTDMLQANMNFAKEQIMEHGSCRLTLVFHSKEIVAVLPQTTETKDAFYRLGALVGLSIAAHAVAVFTEAWMAPADIPKGVAPSESDRREEVVICTLCYRDPETGDLQWLGTHEKMLRGADGKPSGFEPQEQPNSIMPMNQMAALLPEHPPTPETRRAAISALKILQAAGMIDQETVTRAEATIH